MSLFPAYTDGTASVDIVPPPEKGIMSLLILTGMKYITSKRCVYVFNHAQFYCGVIKTILRIFFPQVQQQQMYLHG